MFMKPEHLWFLWGFFAVEFNNNIRILSITDVIPLMERGYFPFFYKSLENIELSPI